MRYELLWIGKSIKIPWKLFKNFIHWISQIKAAFCYVHWHAISLNWLCVVEIHFSFWFFFFYFDNVSISLLCATGTLCRSTHFKRPIHHFVIRNSNWNVQFYAFSIVFAYRNDHWMLQSRINWNNRTEATLMHILYLKVFKECFRVSIALYKILYRSTQASHCTAMSC